MATTSPDNIWSPDSGDDYALTVDLAAMADTVQDAITANKVSLVGLDSARPANGSPELAAGMTWYSTDTGITWRYNGSAWAIEFRPLSAYTPTITGLTAAQISVTAEYERRGNYIDGFVLISRTANGALTGTVTVSLPTTPANSSVARNIGEGLANITLTPGTIGYIINARYTGSNTINLNIPDPSGAALTTGTNLNASFPTSGVHQSGSSYFIQFKYKSA